ncbi:hypothetical protein MJO29_001481, partial [Puccinia striiformis f. sp. tritici]
SSIQDNCGNQATFPEASGLLSFTNEETGSQPSKGPSTLIGQVSYDQKHTTAMALKGSEILLEWRNPNRRNHWRLGIVDRLYLIGIMIQFLQILRNIRLYLVQRTKNIYNEAQRALHRVLIPLERLRQDESIAVAEKLLKI